MTARFLPSVILLGVFALSAADVALGPKGAAILYDASKAQIAELEAHRAAFHKLGVEVATQSRPAPGWIVLDAKRTVVAKYDASYTSAAILAHQFHWTSPDAREVQGKQLAATIGASNATVAPGERIALTIDVDLDPGMHVYAPGVEGYIPIDWKMQETAGAAVLAPMFPRAEKLYLKAIDETVPAYRSHFRL
ncbi:MAG TPA: hypothetical protein VFW44_03150, partial [Bryobacteraceae bacterium]|nr:hypothetical protein [Bryobacteraceae bacterium]